MVEKSYDEHKNDLSVFPSKMRVYHNDRMRVYHNDRMLIDLKKFFHAKFLNSLQIHSDI